MRRLGLSGALTLALLGSAAGAERPRGYVCGRTATPIQIDGRLDEPAWQQAPWTEEFLDIQGDSLPKPRFRTRARMVWDDQSLYIAAQLDEPHVWGTLTRHDAVIFQDNDFEVFIDPDGDNHNYYEIELNALNAEWDLFLDKPYRDGGPARDEWEVPGLKSAVQIQGTLNDPSDADTGWTVELAIPWASLKHHANRPAPPGDGDQWRINFSRVEWLHEVVDGQYRKVPGKPEDNWVWSPQGAIDMHRPEHWGYLQFSAEAPGTTAFRPDPEWPARAYLMSLYHAQRAHQMKHQGFAGRVEALELPEPPALPAGGGKAGRVQIDLTPEGYVATLRPADVTTRGGLQIRQDSRLTRLAEPTQTPAAAQP